MAMVLLLLDQANLSFAIHAESSLALARLGVTRLAVLQERSTVTVLLEGWAFDATSTDRAIEAIGGLPSRVRIFAPVLDASVSTPGTGTISIRPKGDPG